MGKIRLDIDEISNELLAPGNIFWQKCSGVEVMISAKEGIINFKLLSKLEALNEVLLIDESEQSTIQNKFQEVFSQYKNKIQLRDKIKWRNDFNWLLNEYFYKTSNSQYDLDQIFWKIFSDIQINEARTYIDRDKDLFMRSISIASSYTLCAFLIGYYDEKFLRVLYNSALKNLLFIGRDQLVMTLKENLELLRVKTSVSHEDKEIIKSLIDSKDFSQSLFFEKFDGSGLMTLNMFEMSDLELILCSLNTYFSFSENKKINILAEIKNGKFNIEKRIIALIKKNFEMVNTNNLAA